MRHPVVRTIGYLFFGLLVGLVVLEVTLAIRHGHVFYGTNYKGQPLGVTYPIVIAVIFVAVGMWIGIGRVQRFLKRRWPR